MPHQFLFPPVRPSVRGRPDERISTLRSRNAFLKECSIVSARPANPNDFSPSLVIFIYLRFIHISLFLRAALLPSSIRRDLPSPSPPTPLSFSFGALMNAESRFQNSDSTYNWSGNRESRYLCGFPKRTSSRDTFFFDQSQRGDYSTFLLKEKLFHLPRNVSPPVSDADTTVHPVFAHVQRTWLPPAFLKCNCIQRFAKLSPLFANHLARRIPMDVDPQWRYSSI